MSNIQMDYTFRMETATGYKFGPELEIVIFADLVGGAWELTQIEFEKGISMTHLDVNRRNYSTEMRVVWDKVQDDLWNDDELNRRAWLAREEQNEGV